MLIDRDVKGAEEYTKQTISDLLQNKVDLSQLVITKALAKAGQSCSSLSPFLSADEVARQTTPSNKLTSSSLSE